MMHPPREKFWDSDHLSFSEKEIRRGSFLHNKDNKGLILLLFCLSDHLTSDGQNSPRGGLSPLSPFSSVHLTEGFKC